MSNQVIFHGGLHRPLIAWLKLTSPQELHPQRLFKGHPHDDHSTGPRRRHMRKVVFFPFQFLNDNAIHAVKKSHSIIQGSARLNNF